MLREPPYYIIVLLSCFHKSGQKYKKSTNYPPLNVKESKTIQLFEKIL